MESFKIKVEKGAYMDCFKTIGSILAVGLVLGLNVSCKQDNPESHKNEPLPKDGGWDEPPLLAPASIAGTVSLTASTTTLTYTVTCEDPYDIVQCFIMFYDVQQFKIHSGKATANLCLLMVNSTMDFDCALVTPGTYVSISPSCNIPEKGLLVQSPNASMGVVQCPII